jgi:hypothetical protein
MKVFIKLSLLTTLLTSPPVISQETNLSFSGAITGEHKYYPKEGEYDNTSKNQTSLSLAPEIRYSWQSEKHITTFKPFYRYDDMDNQRTHFDVRELNYIGIYGNTEVKAGISKEFWGVTESVHLVDVINQTDLVESIDGESKLGQPMLNLNYISELGTISLYVLPGFRERTFSGKDGRFRTKLNIDTDEAIYTADDAEKNTDYALRWSHYIGNFEWAVSYFRGTDRDPFFNLNSKGELSPVYTQMDQESIEVQYIKGDWLLKSEVLSRKSDLEDRYISTVSGFEYTFSNIKQTGLDIGILSEWVFDERKEDTQGAFYDHTFIGSRVAFNDANSAEMLVGAFLNNQSSKLTSFRIEGSRRINQNFKWELESNMIIEPDQTNSLYQFKDDDYVQAKILYYW